MHKLKIILASTRPGRKGPAVANWIHTVCKENNSFEVELIDLAVVDLPFLDEPKHPKLQQYEHEHTKKWSQKITEGDAFIFVTCEYNHGYPATLKNALDFLFVEWNNKPVGFVSYGGIAGGTRAVQQLKQVVAVQKMVPIAESVNIPFFTKHIGEDGVFTADKNLTNAADDMISELLKWSSALKNMRSENS